MTLLPRSGWWIATLAFVAAALRLGAQETPFEWTVTTPEEQGVDSAPIARLLAEAQRDAVDLHSFVLLRHGRVIAETYVFPYDAATRHRMYSVSKSFTSSLIGIAIERGLISGVDQKVADLFADLAPGTLSEHAQQMTLRHLLTMASGHANDTVQRITVTPNWERAFMGLAVEEQPGTRFVYNSGASYMLACAVQRKAGMSAAAFADEVLFKPLGITDYTWEASPTQVVCGGWGLWLRPLDMARFGQMYLQRGVWNGRQVVPARWVAEAGRKQMNNGTSGFWGSGYGYQFWINPFGGFRADGAFGQYIFILPEQDMVAVFTNNLSDTELPGRWLQRYVLPALSADPLPANPRGEALLARMAAVLGQSRSATSRAPTFLRLPKSQTVDAGSTVTLTVEAAGRPAPTVQWFKDELALSGATSATLTLSDVTAASSGRYVAVLRNDAGATASIPVTVAVKAPPMIVTQPQAIAIGEGGDATFLVEASGEDLEFEWRRNGAPVPGGAGPLLRITAVSASHDGEYAVVVRNPRGSVLSAPARLRVATNDSSARLVNLSVRSVAGTGDQTLIVGFVVRGGGAGDEALPVLLRGVGPSLKGFDLANAAVDPSLVLFDRSVPRATNADWSGSSEMRSAMAQVGAFALASGSADAAMPRVLRAGPYTTHVISGVPDRTGIALAECYDLSRQRATDAPQLVNVAARAHVGTGDDVLIAGFVVEGAGKRRVLIRAIGLTLAEHGVTGALADPSVQLFARTTPLAANEDWSGEELREAFRTTGAFALPAGSKDAALLVDLPAGAYTAHVAGRDGATGVALVEVYALPVVTP